MRNRLDAALVSKQMVGSRTKAQELIKTGKVFVNGSICIKPNYEVNATDNLEVSEVQKYVSRGGHKLEGAIHTLNIKPKGYICADIGASTGGFTDCLLQHSAKKVYSIDVGTHQLHEVLRKDKRVVSMEQTDIRNVTLPEKVDLSVIDVSFISLTHVLKDVAHITKDAGKIIALIKPQFEVGREHILKNGIADPKYREAAIQKVCEYAKTIGLTHKKTIVSPIQGGDGNVEYLALFVK